MSLRVELDDGQDFSTPTLFGRFRTRADADMAVCLAIEDAESQFRARHARIIFEGPNLTYTISRSLWRSERPAFVYRYV